MEKKRFFMVNQFYRAKVEKMAGFFCVFATCILNYLSSFLFGIGIIALPSSIITVKTSVELTNTFHFSLFLPIV